LTGAGGWGCVGAAGGARGGWWGGGEGGLGRGGYNVAHYSTSY